MQRFVRKLHGETTLEARVVIATNLCEKAQVDYGNGLMVRESPSGKDNRTRLSVLTLTHSRKSVRLQTWKRRVST